MRLQPTRLRRAAEPRAVRLHELRVTKESWMIKEVIDRWIRSTWRSFVCLWDVVAFLLVAAMAQRQLSTILCDRQMPHKDKMSLLIAWTGLLLSMVTAYVTIFRPFLRKPRLAVFFDKQWSPPLEPNDSGSWFYRLRIENYGLTRAKACVGKLIGVWTEQGCRIRKFDPLPLFWARQGKVKVDDREDTTFRPIDIQGAGDFDFLDLIQVKEGSLILRVMVPPPTTLVKYPADSASPGTEPILVPGTYYVRIGVYADNVSVSPILVKINCPGDLRSLRPESPPCNLAWVKKLPRTRRFGA